MPVTGIGGVFFRARDSKALTQWYRTHLGVIGEGYTPWAQEAGPTVFMPFAADSSYFPADQQTMINFRVSDLDGLIATLSADRSELGHAGDRPLRPHPRPGRQCHRAVGAAGGVTPPAACAALREAARCR